MVETIAVDQFATTAAILTNCGRAARCEIPRSPTVGDNGRTMEVRTLARDTRVTTELEIRRSRFITWLARAEDEAAARALVDEARRTYPDARHHCSAFIVRVPGANLVERSSDDGEPAGTAGMPMLEVLRGSGLVDVAAVVVRYFGGVKLGTGGLVRAYSDAVRSALDDVAVVIERTVALHELDLPHESAGRIESELRSTGHVVADAAYGAHVTLTVATDDDSALAATVAALTGSRVELRHAGSMVVERPA